MEEQKDYQAIGANCDSLRKIISELTSKETRDQKKICKNLEKIINLYTENTKYFDKINEPGAIQFKCLLVDFYQIFLQFLTNSEERIKYNNQFIEFIRKILTDELEEIGIKTIKTLFTMRINKESCEYQIRTYCELLKFTNTNYPRINEIIKINLNSDPKSSMISMNSIDLFNSCAYCIMISLETFYTLFIKDRNMKKSLPNEIEMLKIQLNNLDRSVITVFKEAKNIDLKIIKTNYHFLILEKYLFFLSQMLYIFYDFEKLIYSQIDKEKVETFCDVTFFILSNSNVYLTLKNAIRVFDELLKLIQSPQQGQQHQQMNMNNNMIINSNLAKFHEYLFKYKSKFLRLENYTKNSNTTDSKYNEIFKFIMRIYFNIKNRFHFNDMIKEVRYLIIKLNDYRINLESKNHSLLFILCAYNEIFSRENPADVREITIYILKQITAFYKTLSSLSSESIGEYLKEEKQQQKEILSKNMLNVKLEENDINKFKKNNVYHLFSILLSNDYDKYILLDDPKNEFVASTLNVIKECINLLRKEIDGPKIKKYGNDIKEQIKEPDIDFLEKKTIYLDKIAGYLSKFFYYFFNIYEKNKVNHQTHDALSMQLLDEIIKLYLNNLPFDLFVMVFKKLMQYILKLYKLGCNICQARNCISQKLIHNIFKPKEPTPPRVVSTLFEIYFEYFSFKTFQVGNPNEIFNAEINTSPSMSINNTINNISILKSIFFNLIDCISDFSYFKNRVLPLIIDYLCLSKKSEYYGNYIYILRCFFKYLKSALQNSLPADKENKLNFNKNLNTEINYILYAIIKYLINVKKNYPFSNETITETIMIIPIKTRFLQEIPQLIVPSLVDAITLNIENMQLYAASLESWMSVCVKHPESVIFHIQKDLTKITSLLSTNLYKPLNINSYLNSLKWLSKIGGKGRNYMEIRKIEHRICPPQTYSLFLYEKNTNRKMNFNLETIIDICNMNCRNKFPYPKKTNSNSFNTIVFIFQNYISIYKNCLLAFFHEKIDYDYIIEMKKNILNGNYDFSNKEYDLENSFKKMNDKNSKIKVNNIYRNVEHYLFEKILVGFSLSYSTLISITNQPINSCSQIGDENGNFLKFLADNFVLMLLSKNNNNKNMLLFEFDPIIVLDDIIFFIFSNTPTILRNPHIMVTELSIEVLNQIIDSINNFFDNDANVIKNLEIIDIIYLKFFTYCYMNEPSKRDIGFTLLKILLTKFDKIINFKYLKYIFRCISSVTSNYPNLIEIKFKKGFNKLVDVIEELLKMFLINNENYYKLTPEMFKEDENISMENEEIKKAKKDFIMLFEFLKYAFDEIVECFDSPKNYSRNLGVNLFNKILYFFPQIKKIIPVLFQIDIDKITIIEFLQFFIETKTENNYSEIISNININVSITDNQINNNENIHFILPNFNEKKIYKKLETTYKTLTKKLGLRDNKFNALTKSADALNNMFDFCPMIINEFIFSENSKNEQLITDVVESLYFNILTDYFMCVQISIYFTNTDFKSNFLFLFFEQLLENKSCEFHFKVKNDNNEDIIIDDKVNQEYIKFIEKYVFDKEHKIVYNTNNNRDNVVGEIFELFGQKLTMIQNFLKLLNNIFTNINIQNEKFITYKNKTKEISLLIVFNRRTSIILKEASRIVINAFNKWNLELKDKESIVYEILDEIDKKNIHIGNNKDKSEELEKEKINILLLLCKTIKLSEETKKRILKKLDEFDNYNEGERQYILFYGFISLFLYIDFKDKKTNEIAFIKIFTLLLKKFKEITIFQSGHITNQQYLYKMGYKNPNNMGNNIDDKKEKEIYHLPNFTQSPYSKYIFKYFIKNRKYLTNYLLNNAIKSEYRYINKFVKVLFIDEKNALIIEAIFREFALFAKQLINSEKNDKSTNKNSNLEKMVYILKICKIIAPLAPLYLLSTNLLEIINPYVKEAIYNIHIGKIKSNDVNINCYNKLFKYWNDLNKTYIENFNGKSNYIYSLFYFYSMNGVSQSEKNKIILFIMYRLSIIINEKKFKAIINEFLKFNKITFIVFDNMVQYLIIPMTIRYLKNTNFFKFLSNQLNSIFKFYPNLLNNTKNKEEKEQQKLLYDEKFILNFIEILTHRLTAIKFDKEKKEEMKFRLLSLIILIYNEYVLQKGKEIENDPQIKNIYYNIQYLLSNPQFIEKKSIGLWRIYLLLDICLFEKLDKNEQEIETTLNFYKNLSEDYQDIEALSYEVILPYYENNHSGQLFDFYYKEGNYSIIRILMVLLKFPNIILKQNEKFINLILSSIFKYAQNYSKLSLVLRKQLIQIMGIIITFISRQKTLLRKPKQKNDNNPINKINENISQQNKNLIELELLTYRVTYKLYKSAFFNSNDNNINENFEIIKRLIVYLRELLNSETQLQMMLAVYDNKSKEAYIKHIHAHIQMLRVYMIYIRMDTIYKNLNLYFDLHRILTEDNMSYRYFNDFALVFRLLTDDKLLLKMNTNKERPNENVLYEHKFQMFNRIKEILKIKKKIITFSNEIPTRNYNFDEIGKKIQTYLESNFGNLEIANINNNQNIRHIQQIPQSQLSTNENLPTTHQTNIPQQQNIQNNNNIAQQNIQIQNQNVNNVINHGVIQQQGNIQNQINNNTGINDKWLSAFPINDLKYFIFQKRFVEDIYVTINKNNSFNNMSNIIPQNSSENNNINNNNAQVENNYNNLPPYNKLVCIARDSIDIQKNIQTYTYQYYENFYHFTIYFLREYKQQYDYNKKNFIGFYKEIRDYFGSSHNFYYNLRNYEDLKYIRNEPIDCVFNDKDKNKNKAHTFIYNILIVYPDAILSAFYFFLDCKEIMEKEYAELLRLLIYAYRHFREKFYDQLLEHLISSVMSNKYLQNKPEVKNKFMYDILSCTEIIYKMAKTNENIISIFIRYLKNYLASPIYNKKETYLMQSLHLIIYNTTKFELKKKKEIFKILKAYIGNNLIDSLKWIFPINSGDEILNVLTLEYIPYSIDLLLSYFKDGVPLQLNKDNFSKFKNLQKTDKNSENEMIIETNENTNHMNNEYDKNGYIRNMVDNSNILTKEKKVESLMDPIRNIVFTDGSCNKIFLCSFTQIWKILSMNERENLSLHINEFLYNHVIRLSEKLVRNESVELLIILIETFSQCSPIIYIKPNIIYSLLQNNNLWSAVIFYLENLLVSGIEVSATYTQLINVFSKLKEKDLVQGLKYYFSKTETNQKISSSLQIDDYKNAEKLIYNCFAELGKILDNINIENINFNDENSIDPLEIENFEIFSDLSIWETDLIECYENTNKWNNVVEISNYNNDCDLKVKGLWNCGHEKWKELDKFTKAIEQYEKPEKFNTKNPYYIQVNEIYLNNKIEEIDEGNPRRNEPKYHGICMSTLNSIFQDFKRFPKNLENIDYYYFLIFQVIFEAWESMNYYSETIKKLKEKSKINLKDNLLLWRERLPHYCEGFQSVKCILEPRNYLFNMLKNKILNLNRVDEVNFQQIADKVWNDTIFLKYSRKLKLYDKFYDYLNILNKEDNCNAKNFPYETFCKDIEHIKFIRNNSYNYELGIKFIDNYIKEYTSLKVNKDVNLKTREELIPYVENVLKSKKAYFLYKKGDILSAHKLFTEASIFNGKSITDYHLYYDWADMCEEIAITIKGNEGVSDWFENTIHNLLYTIIYKLDKAKYIIPRIINLIREFPEENLKNRFNEEIMEIPTWIWIFWLNVLFENFSSLINDDNRNDFYFVILKRIAKQYKQIFYYPFRIYEENYYNKQNTSTNGNKYKDLHDILFEDNIYDHSLDKIQLIIDELTKKEKENEINSLNNILNYCEKMTYKNQKLSAVKSLFQNIVQFLDKFPSLSQFKNNIEKLLQNNEATRNQLRECAIKNKNYIHNLITTENKFLKFSKLREELLHNTDFSNIELPGYFSNKIIEPTVENIIYISRFESEYIQKLINDPRSKIFIKTSNEKLFTFIIKNDDITNIDMKIYMLQIIFNFIFAKNMKTYKKKVCFCIPIKYHIAPSIKIVEEDDFKYNLNEIYEFCLQQRGYDPKISNQIFEEEANKSNVNSDLVYYSSENNEKLFYKMCKIIPQDCLRNFIHRFILNYDDILVFRKQFTASYSINNLFNFILSDNIILKNITFNKETGLCTLNSDLTLFADNEYKEIIEQKEGTPLRLTKNISYFLSIASIYGVIPGIFNASCEALLQKQKILKNILKICLCPADKFDNEKSDKIVQNYVNKFKFVINIGNDEINKIVNNNVGDINNNINNMTLENKKDNGNNINTIEREDPLKIVYELIENSMNNENLKKKTIDYDAWF